MKQSFVTICKIFQVLSIGDYYQLPPTGGSVPYKLGTSRRGIAGRNFIIASFNLFSELTTPNYRQIKDPILTEMCTAARVCSAPSPGLLDQLNSRFTTVEVAKSSVTPDALWTASTWSVVDKLNTDHLEQCRLEKKTIVNLYAK
jgi:hypothetical protein